ncbi:MAG TPA: hypothetical protein VFB02_16430 [Bradyrhizobium sp.]|nr:hypothetical protein [Bradyrhizobium sp.]
MLAVRGVQWGWGMDKNVIGLDRWFELGFTAAIVIATVANVYTARLQWSTMNESNRISTRPYIKITLKPDTFLLHSAGIQQGDFPGVKFRVENIGKLPALVWVRSAANWNGRGRSGDEKTWPSIGVVARKFVFPGSDETDFPSYQLGFTPGQLTDIATGDRYYVLVDAAYGPSKNIELYEPSEDYETKVCTVFQVKRAGDVITLGDGEPCPSEGSNSAR